MAGEKFPAGESTFSGISVYGLGVRTIGSGVATSFEYYDLSASTGTLKVNYGTRDVLATLDLKGRLIQSDGSLSSTVTQFPRLTEGTRRIRTITPTRGVDGSYQGQFTTDGIRGFDFYTGWFFGPGGAEAGFAFDNRPNPPLAGGTDFSDFRFVGVVVAKR